MIASKSVLLPFADNIQRVFLDIADAIIEGVGDGKVLGTVLLVLFEEFVGSGFGGFERRINLVAAANAVKLAIVLVRVVRQDDIEFFRVRLLQGRQRIRCTGSITIAVGCIVALLVFIAVCFTLFVFDSFADEYFIVFHNAPPSACFAVNKKGRPTTNGKSALVNTEL